MELIAGAGARSIQKEPEEEATALESLQFTDEIHRLIAAPPDSSSSFTALLELSALQAVELLHSPESANLISNDSYKLPQIGDFKGSLHFPTDIALVERAARFSVFAGESNKKHSSNNDKNSAETSSNASSADLEKAVKSEPVETESSQPLVSDPTVDKKSVKRKEREKKAKGSSKKSKKAGNESSEDAEKLPYVHVRARRGQATDSHSLAERARREKINARMKLLQELVPGCNKISGTALVLDEIINHVQSLQRQVEFLSMRLAAVNPGIDFNLDSIFTPEGTSLTDSSFPSMVMPVMWPEAPVSGNRQQYQQQWHLDTLHQPVWGREEVCHNYITPENSLLSYDSPTNSATLHSNRLKMEL